jgi:hypothetical protein
VKEAKKKETRQRVNNAGAGTARHARTVRSSSLAPDSCRFARPPPPLQRAAALFQPPRVAFCTCIRPRRVGVAEPVAAHEMPRRCTQCASNTASALRPSAPAGRWRSAQPATDGKLPATRSGTPAAGGKRRRAAAAQQRPPTLTSERCRGCAAAPRAAPLPPRVHAHVTYKHETHMIGPAARARGAAGAALTALPRKAEGARPPGAMEKAEADATKAARRAHALVLYMAVEVPATLRVSQTGLLVPGGRDGLEPDF